MKSTSLLQVVEKLQQAGKKLATSLTKLFLLSPLVDVEEIYRINVHFLLTLRNPLFNKFIPSDDHVYLWSTENI